MAYPTGASGYGSAGGEPPAAGGGKAASGGARGPIWVGSAVVGAASGAGSAGTAVPDSAADSWQAVSTPNVPTPTASRNPRRSTPRTVTTQPPQDREPDGRVPEPVHPARPPSHGSCSPVHHRPAHQRWPNPSRTPRSFPGPGRHRLSQRATAPEWPAVRPRRSGHAADHLLRRPCTGSPGPTTDPSTRTRRCTTAWSGCL